ncbi:tripartite tricarboxylate transporter substrate binding protein [Bordetella sp. BOR01]|uniref:Bug family tripartite tricarboxylate transporter substrate binding protein n=1 Tax=Bordetella sp. BOR01 TaxID=2854779 RepID=UPI001C4798ED|nr:tripartite tricarboxylate transporter substrate binding protein [Bordetella sp. BOR01]MBV7485078.1 tripartite tricarboxylate transporter substrate binding protein [Bordetella sp. BOR01]
MNRLCRLIAPVASCILPALAGQAAAQDFPAHPVALVVPYPAGGSADILARAIGEKLGEKLGQPVVVENKSGAGTAIGARYVAQAPADGYTLLLGTVSSHAINPAIAKVGYDPIRDFALVAPVASTPFVLVTPAASSFRTLSDVIAAARRQPEPLDYASAGPGTSNHLAGEMLANATKVRLVHVPYRGSAPALVDVMAGHVPLMFDLQTTSIPNIRQGKLRALAVTSLQRSSLLPGVPTVAESGMPGFEVSAWFAVFAPAKVPAQTLQRLQAAMSAVMDSDDLKQQLRQIGAEPDPRSPGEFAVYLEQEIKKYAAVVKAAGLAPH